MRKLFLIALKDVKLIFRDRAALIFMFLAPFALTIGLGLVTGGFSSGASDSGISDIPVVVVNEDGSSLGNAFVEMLQSDDLADLLEPQISTDLSAARKLVDDNKVIAAIYIPEGFTASIIPQNLQSLPTETLQVELYGNPTSPTSLGIVKSIVEQFMTVVESERVRSEVTITQLLTNMVIDQTQISAIAQSIAADQSSTNSQASSIKLNNVTAAGKEVTFNVLAVIAPAMALMFLMYTVTNGGRSLLVEMNSGTLPRLLVSPTSTIQVLGGKVLGIFFNGMAQMLILIIGTTLIFKLDWGDPWAVLVLVAVAVLAATGWGILLAAGLKTAGQISNIGSAIMLIFGILGGGFVSVSAMPDWVQLFSRISPNRWGLDGFTTLALGGALSNILTPVIALLIMAAVLFLVSVILFARRGIGKQ